MSEEHRYGYRTDEAGMVIQGMCSVRDVPHVQSMVTSHQCHGVFLCLPCLTQHAAGVSATYAGDLTEEKP